MNQSDYLAFCRNELRRSKRWRGNKTGYGFDDQWRKYVDLYGGLHYDVKSGADQLTVNLVFSTINVMGPAVAINNPRFVVSARKEGMYDQARVTEEVLNYLWRTHKYQREFRLSVHDWMIIGHAWLKVGYKAVKNNEDGMDEWEQVTKKVDPPPMDTDSASEGADEGIDDREPIPGNSESEMHVDDDRPYVERISPFDMYVDPDARHPKEMRWIAQRTWRAVQDVMADSRYSPTNRKRVSGSSWGRWSSEDGDARYGSDSNFRSDRPDRGAMNFVEVIEFYDLKRNQVSTFVPDAGEEADAGFLIKPDRMPYADGHPFVMLRNYEVPDHFYTIGDVQQIESLQLELNETRNQMLNYRKKFRRAWVYSKDMFDPEGIRALESDRDNVMIPVMGDNNPGDLIAPVPAAITPPEFFDQSAMISADLDRVSGVSDYQRGQVQNNMKRTATEAAMIQDAANARAQDRLAKIEGILSEVAERIIGLMQQFLTGEHVARIVTMPINGWVTYDEDYIQGKFDFEVRGGSTEPRNETFRRQSAMQLVDASMPFLEMGIANPTALYQKILQDGFGEKDVQRFINQPDQAPQPNQQQAPPPGQEGAPPPGGPPAGPPGGMPPEGDIDPAMLEAMMAEGQMPPPGMDPAMAGGPPPIDPAMIEQMMADGMDPAMIEAMLAEQGGSPQTIPPEMLAMLEQQMGMGGGMPPA